RPLHSFPTRRSSDLLSPASCAAVSFGTNVPEPALGLAAVAAAGLAVAALAASGPAIMAPTTPPVSSEPATAAPTRNLLIGFISHTYFFVAGAGSEGRALRNRATAR